MIPELDLRNLLRRDPGEMSVLARAVQEVGFLTVSGTDLTSDRVERVLDAYRAFFRLPDDDKRAVDMARTGANRGWGAPKSEQVDPDANPDFKEVFDCGYELPDRHPFEKRNLGVYAPNQWPEKPLGFRAEIEAYYSEAISVGREILSAISDALGQSSASFADAFDPPMALLRGNFYSARPEWAGDKDFGIAAHTDYGCLTLLAMDGAPGLEVRMPDGRWEPIIAAPGTFVINFGEMLEMWSGGRIKATLHRVIGGAWERISVPLFLNPAYDTNVAPPGSGQIILAGEHLSRRFNETYLHLKTAG
ncbi:2-oxoglutarate and iron-dependent oxygenase domain-containing protein [Sedimentitalea sp. JM2-8]|uniref:2-oxoglutarate-dependent ethylene/succinate-forming enzyme n=1 Tax=Sedimentitalea xiamensis TaxID=3050037 RepID=A0ABT7FA95_9RHOB|nr:2-oxoglutarate and iron-dependent oxygenase domain-containing protein [Sedimentitalea xiamensis]MDK3072024.1 2-oxoglutarate and iron-dependent oxygenase domain-containing protein [Sedimentitalea xiamensis]